MDFGLSNAVTRLVTFAGLAVAGSVATTIGTTGSLSTALVATCGGVAANILSSDVHKLLIKGLWRRSAVYAGDNLDRLVIRAVQLVIENPDSRYVGCSKLLKHLSWCVRKHWHTLQQAPLLREKLEDLSESRLPDYVPGMAQASAEMTVLDPVTWRMVLDTLAAKEKRPCNDAVLEGLAQDLYHGFPQAIWSLLRIDADNGDGNIASIQLTLLAEVLQRLPTESSRSEFEGDMERFQEGLHQLWRDSHRVFMQLFDRLSSEGRERHQALADSIDTLGRSIELLNHTADETRVLMRDIYDIVVRMERRASESTDVGQQGSQLRAELIDAQRGIARIGRVAETGDPDAVAALRSHDRVSVLKRLVAIRESAPATATLEENREIAALAFLCGDTGEAERTLRAILRAQPDDRDARNRLGWVHFRRYELMEAENCFKEILERASGQRLWEATASGNLGAVYLRRGDLNAAEVMILRGLSIEEELEDWEGIADSYGILGLLYKRHENMHSAKRCLRRSIRYNKRLGRKASLAIQYGNLALIHLRENDIEKAHCMCLRSLSISARLGNQEGLARRYGDLGAIYLRWSKLRLAKRHLLHSLRVSRDVDWHEGVANALMFLGRVYGARMQQYLMKSRETYDYHGMQEEAKIVQTKIEGLSFVLGDGTNAYGA